MGIYNMGLTIRDGRNHNGERVGPVLPKESKGPGVQCGKERAANREKGTEGSWGAGDFGRWLRVENLVG